MDTTVRKLENLKVPRDREGKFRTKLIEPYRRRDISLEDLILGMFASGMSLRSVARALESIFELKYSPSTISQISQVTVEEISRWKQRKLKRGYAVIMLDGMCLSVRKDIVEKEALLFVSDEITGLEERIREYFPKADFQSCVVHKVRNTLNKVRAKDLRKIYQSSTEEETLKGFEKFKEKWKSRYPEIVKS